MPLLIFLGLFRPKRTTNLAQTIRTVLIALLLSHPTSSAYKVCPKDARFCQSKREIIVYLIIACIVIKCNQPGQCRQIGVAKVVAGPDLDDGQLGVDRFEELGVEGSITAIEAAYDSRSHHGPRSADKDGAEDDPSWGKGYGPLPAKETGTQTAEETGDDGDLEKLSDAETSHPVLAADVLELRLALFADVHHHRATGIKIATLGWIGRAGHIAFQNDGD
jgi:hypothetical protein